MRIQGVLGLLVICGVCAYQAFWWLQERVRGRFDVARDPAGPPATIHRRLRRIHWLAYMDREEASRRRAKP